MKKMLVSFVIVVFAAPSIALADGKSDYHAKCAACHGANANLLPKMARLLKADPKKLALKTSTLSRDEMITTIEKGRDKMPGFEKELTREQIEAVVDYVLGLGNK